VPTCAAPDMLADCNRTAHPYDEAVARAIWQGIGA
jgi:hypothetical protein